MRWGKLYRGTPAELSLEEAVACLGVPYRTQFPGYLFGFRYFPDFFLPTIGVVIEVDDASHSRSKKMEEDEERTRALEARGWQVVRCTNEEALSDPHGAVKRMLSSVGHWPPLGTKSLAEAMPKSQKATQKQQRAARSSALRARRVNKRRPGD